MPCDDQDSLSIAMLGDEEKKYGKCPFFAEDEGGMGRVEGEGLLVKWAVHNGSLVQLSTVGRPPSLIHSQ